MSSELARLRRRLPGVEELVLYVLRRRDPRARRAWRQIDTLLAGTFRSLGLNPVRRQLAWGYLKGIMRLGMLLRLRLHQIEGGLTWVIERRQRPGAYRRNARRRAERIYGQLEPHLVGDSLLDLGAGNGLVGELIHQRRGMRVTLTDVVDYSLSSLPITIHGQGERLPVETRSHDTTVIYLVLHHADDPDQLLREAVRATRRRLIIMEGDVDEPENYLVNGFLDWFLNRVLQRADIPIPLNYRTSAEWRRAFDRLGLTIRHAEKVGIDDPLAPEHHQLFVLEPTAHPS